MALPFDEFEKPFIILKEQVHKIRTRDLDAQKANLAAVRAFPRILCTSLLDGVVLLVGIRSPAVGLAASSQEASINNTRIPSLGTTTSALEEPIAPPVPVKYTHLLIDGKFVNAASGKTFPRLDPRTGDLIVNVAESDAEDVDRVVSVARKAFDEGPWPKMTAYERSCIMIRFADLLEKHNDEIAALETRDNGKPYEQAALVEVPMEVQLFRYYAGWEDKICGLTVPVDGPYQSNIT